MPAGRRRPVVAQAAGRCAATGVLPDDWPLRATAVPAAWRTTRGAGVVVAVVDEAVDARHPEFAGRVVAGYDAERGSNDPLPRRWQPHGTKAAGVAVAAGLRVTGVAPEARLMPVRVESLARRAGTLAEADAIRWAAGHGADVMCCAWGPAAGRERADLPAHTRDAVEEALTRGRGGKGCVIVFSAGNDGADVALNGYASHPGVVAVGACNRGGRRCAYSNWGGALWCVFPSGEPAPRPGDPDDLILTTTPVGSFLVGETYYAYVVGHTSTAAAGVAGIAALILGANPDLTWREVKAVLRDSCVKIDGRAGGYDARGHSPFYGYGRPDAARAVGLALARRRAPTGVRW